MKHTSPEKKTKRKYYRTNKVDNFEEIYRFIIESFIVKFARTALLNVRSILFDALDFH